MDFNYMLVIDTDKYAGNFERELCGYCTGYWDNETHGGEQAKLFYEEVVGSGENPFANYIEYISTEHDGYYTDNPQCIYPTPKESRVRDIYNSVGIFFNNDLPKELVDLIKERAIKFGKEGEIFGRRVGFKVIGFRFITRQIKVGIKEIAI